MKCTDIAGAITEGGDRHSTVSRDLRSKSQTVGDRHAATDDPRCNHYARFRMRDVHGSTLALTCACRLTKQLRPELSQRNTASEGVVKATIVGADKIVWQQRGR